MWEIFEVFKNPALLSRVRTELEAVSDTNMATSDASDLKRLMSVPLLESIYAEVLRLRIYAYCARYTGEQDLQLNQWRFPKKSILLVSTHLPHMDETYWNTRDGAYPVDAFWADRFLVYADDPQSGAGKPSRATAEGPRLARSRSEEPSARPTFTTAGTHGAWMPYGGGPRVCPGRFFAEQSMTAALAIMASHYDVEFRVRDGSPALRLDPKFYGWAGQWPVSKLPFRIRGGPQAPRRARSSVWFETATWEKAVSGFLTASSMGRGLLQEMLRVFRAVTCVDRY